MSGECEKCWEHTLDCICEILKFRPKSMIQVRRKMNEEIDFLIKILNRVKNCDKALTTLKYISENSVFKEGFKNIETQNDCEKWRKYIHDSILFCISIIEDIKE